MVIVGIDKMQEAALVRWKRKLAVIRNRFLTFPFFAERRSGSCPVDVVNSKKVPRRHLQLAQKARKIGAFLNASIFGNH